MNDFENAGSVAFRVLAGLAEKREEHQAKATAAAVKIGTAEHHKTLGAIHELHAEQAQWLAAKEAAWERLIESGFVT